MGHKEWWREILSSKLTHFSLFTGIGGIDLAAEWAGFESVGQCEFADYPTKVLEKHWPNVPRWRDVRDVTAESVRERGITNITVLSGGFPCQPFSVAGEQRGENDDRYLWPEMLRVIEELRPTWVIGENVVGIVKMALDKALFDLENKNYTAIPFIIPACSVGAEHKRERVFIMAHSECSGLQIDSKESSNNRLKAPAPLEHDCFEGTLQQDNRIWPSESKLRRVANGFPDWMDRIKCLGNAVVPQQVYPILKSIADIERSSQHDRI